jgi:hypothetical protein
MKIIAVLSDGSVIEKYNTDLLQFAFYCQDNNLDPVSIILINK